MTARSVTHATFTIERTYDAAPARVFAAWASVEAKARWMGCDPTWVQGKHELDFRVGGREMNRSGPKGGPVHAFDALYHDIVANERIVYSYDLRLGDRLISVSLATIEFKRQGAGTRMTLTEQGAFLDGYDGAAEREEGTREGMDRLGAALASMPA
jgi:uncharacterized protein YndB with AHSA1/START domain